MHSVALVALVLALALAVRLNGLIDLGDPYFRSWDEHYYLAMAEQPLSDDEAVHVAPFCWRILVPWLAHVLPVEKQDAFWLITVTALCVLVVQVRRLALELGASATSALGAGIAAALLGPLTGYTLHSPYYPDPLSLALIVVQMRLFIRGRYLAFIAATLVSTLAKESALIACVFALAWAASTRDGKGLRVALLGLFLWAGITAAVRLAIPSVTSYTFFGELRRVHVPFSLVAERQRLLAAFGHAWSGLLPAACAGLLLEQRRNIRWAFLAVCAVVLGQLVIAIAVERLMIYAAPAVLVASALALDALAKRFGTSALLPWGLVWLTLVPGFLNHANVFGRHGKSSPRPLTFLALASVLAATCVVLYHVKRRLERTRRST